MTNQALPQMPRRFGARIAGTVSMALIGAQLLTGCSKTAKQGGSSNASLPTIPGTNGLSTAGSTIINESVKSTTDTQVADSKGTEPGRPTKTSNPITVKVDNWDNAKAAGNDGGLRCKVLLDNAKGNLDAALNANRDFPVQAGLIAYHATHGGSASELRKLENLGKKAVPALTAVLANPNSSSEQKTVAMQVTIRWLELQQKNFPIVTKELAEQVIRLKTSGDTEAVKYAAFFESRLNTKGGMDALATGDGGLTLVSAVSVGNGAAGSVSAGNAASSEAASGNLQPLPDSPMTETRERKINIEQFTEGYSQANKQTQFDSHAAVLLDESHEMEVGCGHQIVKFGLTELGFNVAQNLASLRELPDGIKLIFIPQNDSFVPYSTAEIERLTRFVNEGGSLVIFAHKNASVVKVANAFGIEVEGNVHLQYPLTIAARFCADGSSKIQKGGNWCFSKLDSDSAIKDASGRQVGVLCSKGNGKVLCIPDYQDAFSPTKENAAAFLKGVMPAGLTLSSKKGACGTVYQECSQTVNGVTFLYSNELRSLAESRIPKLLDIVSYMKWECPGLMQGAKYPLSISFVAGTGEGEKRRRVLIALGGSDEDFTCVSSHELSHYESSALPAIFEEGLAYRGGSRISGIFFPDRGASETRKWHANYEKSLKDTAIDHTKMHGVYDFVSVGWAYGTIEKLETTFGNSLFPRVIEANRTIKVSQSGKDLSETMYLIKLVAQDICGKSPEIDGQSYDEWCQSLGLPAPGPRVWRDNKGRITRTRPLAEYQEAVNRSRGIKRKDPKDWPGKQGQ